MITADLSHSNLHQLFGSTKSFGAKTVSLTTIWHNAFSAGYWEQTYEGSNREREDINVHSQKTY